MTLNVLGLDKSLIIEAVILNIILAAYGAEIPPGEAVGSNK
jgi:hypothetical protein